MIGATERILSKYRAENTPVVYLPYSRLDEYPRLLNELGARRGVEIGVYRGQYCETLCKFIPGLDLTGVDAWTVYEGYSDYGAAQIEQGHKEAADRAARFGFKLLRAWSMDAVQQFADNSLDFVFIDASHDFQSVTNDLAAWSRKVKPGGIVSGHDYCTLPEINRAAKTVVDAWCEVNNIRPLFVWTADKWPTWMYVRGER